MHMKGLDLNLLIVFDALLCEKMLHAQRKSSVFLKVR
ncbi:Uncharacterised protein [Serratia quinivorans]|nr:Uncharacterised protein [Serratia quinivorans]